MDKETGISKEDVKKGVQIIYIPTHCKGNIFHEDIQKGFIMSLCNDKKSAFCRYFYSNGDLRTRANSESTPLDMLYLAHHSNQKKIDDTIKFIEKEQEDFERFFQNS